MSPFNTAAILLAIAALAGYLNVRFLRLPHTSGTLVVALASSVAVVVADFIFPEVRLQAVVSNFLTDIDFNKTLMGGMLCFLLFAGALHVDLTGLIENRGIIAALATVSVALSTAVLGSLAWAAFHLVGINVPLITCFVLGALLSPTDPIAVMGLLRELGAPRRLEAQIAGESLFNDGIGVVVFFGILSVAGFVPPEGGGPINTEATGLVRFFLREVLGGVGLGLALGYAGFRALKSIDDHAVELLITLALVMFTYSVSFAIDVSGPIAVVVAGLLIGNPGRALAMSKRTREHVDAFWSMLDAVLNSVLFLLLGLEIFAVPTGPRIVLAALCVVPIALLARAISVAPPVAWMRFRHRSPPGLLPVLTWSGLRGGISVAMVLSLPPFADKPLLLAATYAVVVFSIVVQGLTMRRLLTYYGIGREPRPA